MSAKRGAPQKAFEQLEKLIEYIKHSAGLVIKFN